MVDIRLLGFELGVDGRTSRTIPGDRSAYRTANTFIARPSLCSPLWRPRRAAAATASSIPGMPSIGLVLSAGGDIGRAYHAGTLAALAEATGWDPRRADLIVGTSAGASAAAFLRSGLSAPDDYARLVGAPLSAEGEALLARPPAPVPGRLATRPSRSPRRAPLRATLAARALAGQAAPVTGLAGLAPRGRASNAELGDRIRGIGGDRWPESPTWICAVRVRDGRRVVFGRDDLAPADLGLAVRASCAIPRVFEPVTIGGVEYLDGAVHSSTNADLVAQLAFDLVVVVSSMTVTGTVRRPPASRAGLWWFSRSLHRELASIRGRGTPVLVIQPTATDLAARRVRPPDVADVARRANDAARAILEQPHARDARLLLGDAAAFVPPITSPVTSAR